MLPPAPHGRQDGTNPPGQVATAVLISSVSPSISNVTSRWGAAFLDDGREQFLGGILLGCGMPRQGEIFEQYCRVRDIFPPVL
jgi:hypothetical protein